MKLLILNIALFQIGWFSCVLGGAYGYGWIGVLVVAAVIGIHLYLAERPKQEVMVILFALAIGTTWDSALTLSGIMQFDNGILIQGMAPYWLIAMWALFATTLNVSMSWLKGRLAVSAITGLVGGPIAYYAGYKLGAVQFHDVTIALIVIAIGWAIIMPLLSVIAQLNNGFNVVNAGRMA